MATRRDLDAPNHSIRHRPLVHRNGPQTTMQTASEWQRIRAQTPDSDDFIDDLSDLAEPLPFPRVAPAILAPIYNTAQNDVLREGRRVNRARPLAEVDLYLGDERPPVKLEELFDEHTCSICHNLKSHPVS